MAQDNSGVAAVMKAMAGEPEAPAPPEAIPQSFTDCAAAFRRTVAPEGSQRQRPFNCTWRHYEGLDPATTYDFAMAGNSAITIGDHYIDEILQPGIAARLAAQVDNEGWAETRGRLLDAFIRAARHAGSARCAVVGDIWNEGTMRVAVASSCGIQNRDALIDDLLGIEEHMLPR